MEMNTDKKSAMYYYLKMPFDFFTRPEVLMLRTMEHGYEIICLFLQMVGRAAECSGYLRFTDYEAFTAQTLAASFMLDVSKKDVCESALVNLKRFGLIDILDDGTIFINNIEEFVGSETVWAEKKRQQREAARIKLDKERSEQKQKEESKRTDEGQKGTTEGQCPDNVPKCPDNVHIYREEKKREELERECCARARTRERENTRPTEEEVSEIVSELKLDGFNVKKFVSFWNACDWKDKNGRDVSKNLKDRILYWHETEPIIQNRSGNVLKVTEPCRSGYQRDQYGFEFMVNESDHVRLEGQAANDLLDQLLAEK